MPIRLPNTNGTDTESSPIWRSSLVLKAILLQMSRPKLSVPRMWPGLKGGRNASVNRCSIGSYGVSSGAVMAMTMTRPSSARPVSIVGSTRIFPRRVARPSCESGTASVRGRLPIAFSLIRHPRIEEQVRKVDHQIDHAHQDPTDHADRLAD